MKPSNYLSIALLAFLFLNCHTFHSSDTVESAKNYPKPPGTIQFTGDAGSPNVFTVMDWRFTQAEIPEGDIEQIKVALILNTASITTDWKDLEKSVLKKKDYFYVKLFPEATILIDGAEKIDEQTYQTEAMLTLKGISNPVKLTFTLEQNHVVGKGVITRELFKFNGEGPKSQVPVSFDVYLPMS